MLQYPIAHPPLSSVSPKLPTLTSKDNSDYFRHNDSRFSPAVLNKRIVKDDLTAKPPFNTGLSHPILSVATNPSSPSSVSSSPSKLPRSPYISSRRTSSPVSVPSSRQFSSKSLNDSSRPSSVISSTLEDVLVPGDPVGQGSVLQGEKIRLVSIGNCPRYPDVPNYEEPAKEFEVVRRLGAGSYAVVYLVREVLYRAPPSDDGHMSAAGNMDSDWEGSRPSTVYGREYAIKCLSKVDLDEEALAAQMTEVTIHQSLRSHPNIVTLHRTLETSSFLLLILEYVPGEDLFYFLEQARDHYDQDPHTTDTSVSRTPPSPGLLSSLHPSQLLSRTRLHLIASMFSQMCDAVAACHEQQVFHRDIKPENFIVTDGWVTMSDGRQERKVIVKLSDFGLSTTDVESSDMDCGSAPYMSYECRNNVAPTYRPRAADVWSLGIVLINMLYHCNPWTDTEHDACSSFGLYLSQPVNFFLTRFTGMTRPVAEFLASKVFNILVDTKDDSQRVTARDFGIWIRDLPDLFIEQRRSGHKRTVSTSSQGYPISSSTPASHRPSSRQASGISIAIRTPILPPRSLSRAPSLSPAYERPEAELSTVIDQELEEQDEDIETASRSTSTTKRRKRGARKGKGVVTSTSAAEKDDTLVNLAVASESLAREISKASRTSSRMSSHSSSTKQSGDSSKRRKPYEPVSMYPVPTALCSGTVVSVPTSPSSLTFSSSSSSSTPPVPVPPTSVVPHSAPVKKPSIWRLNFGKPAASSPLAGRMSPTKEIPYPPTSIDIAVDATHSSLSQQPVSATVENVSSLIHSLEPSSYSAPAVGTQTDDITDYPRGRRSHVSPIAPRNVYGRNPHGLSPSPHPSVENRWGPDGEHRSDRAVSPNSTRSGRYSASSASSMASGNWRNSMSTMSSAGTSTSAFTRYSNSSTRSVSSAATSVSGQSWRTTNSKPGVPSSLNPQMPKNIKVLDGVPWELTQVARGQYANPVGDIFGQPPPRKARTRKPKDLKLDTINERPMAARKTADIQRGDASTSTSDLSGTSSSIDGDSNPKKVQKGQINALAKMLSALRR